jgi:hypothetical protein
MPRQTNGNLPASINATAVATDVATKSLAAFGEWMTDIAKQIKVTISLPAVDSSATSTASRVLNEISKNLAGFGNTLNVVTSIARNLFQVVGVAFTVVKDVLQSIVAVFSIIGSLFSVVTAVFEGLINAVKAVTSAVASVISSVSSGVAKIVGDSHSRLAQFLTYAAGAAIIAGAAFIAAGIAAEHAWQPLADTLARISIAGTSAKTIGGLRELADQISLATTVASSKVLELAENAVRLRIPADSLQAVTAAAVGLSAALGIGQSEALGALNKALRGNVDALKEYIPQLKGVKDQTQQITIIQQAAAAGFDLAAKKASTFAGFWAQLKNVFAANAQRLGEAIAPGIKLVVDALHPLVGMLQSSGAGFAAVFNGLAAIVAPILGTIVGGLQYLQTALLVVLDLLPQVGGGFDGVAASVRVAAAAVDRAMKAIATGMLSAFALAKTLVIDWRTTWELMKSTVEWAAAEVIAIARHFFKDQFAPLFAWFTENAKTWLGQLGEGLKTGFVNLFANLGNVVSEGWDALVLYFTGGGKGGFQGIGASWKNNLLEGFRFTATALPELAGRQVDAAQEELRKRIGSLSGKIGQEWQAELDKALANFNARLGQTAQDPKVAIDGLKKLPKDDSASKGHADGNNLTESRLLTRAPGGVIARQQLELTRQQLAEQRAASEAAKRAAAALEKNAVEIAALRGQIFNMGAQLIGGI